jgi:hypothetical protein
MELKDAMSHFEKFVMKFRADVLISCWDWHRTATVHQICHYDNRLYFEILMSLDCIICSLIALWAWFNLVQYILILNQYPDLPTNVWQPWIMIFSFNISLNKTLTAAPAIYMCFEQKWAVMLSVFFPFLWLLRLHKYVCFEFIGMIDIRNIEPKMFCHVHSLCSFFLASSTNIFCSTHFFGDVSNDMHPCRRVRERAIEPSQIMRAMKAKSLDSAGLTDLASISRCRTIH